MVEPSRRPAAAARQAGAQKAVPAIHDFGARAVFTHARPDSDSLDSADGVIYRAETCCRVIGRQLSRRTRPMRSQGSRHSCCPQSVRQFRYC